MRLKKTRLSSSLVGITTSKRALSFSKSIEYANFLASGMTLLKLVTLIANNGVIEAVHYPIFPSDSDPAWVIDYLKRH